jgi:hypothetical protein
MGVIPIWARTGFSEAEPAMPHVLTRSGDVVAIVFGFPLASPPKPCRPQAPRGANT